MVRYKAGQPTIELHSGRGSLKSRAERCPKKKEFILVIFIPRVEEHFTYYIAMHALGKKFRLAVSQRARLRKTIAARVEFGWPWRLVF